MRNILLLLLILTMVPYHTLAVAEDQLTINRYDAQFETWTIITLEDMKYRVNTSSGILYQGELVSDVWERIAQLTTAIDFYSLSDSVPENYTLSIALQTDKGSNTVYLTPELEDYLPDFGKFVTYVLDFYNRVTGNKFQQRAWPLDVSILQSRTIPSEYFISSVLQRGADMLTYVLVANVTLVIGEAESDIYNTTWMQSASYIQTKSVSFAAGGDSIKVNFDPLDVSKIGAIADVVFAVVLDVPLIYTFEFMQPLLLSSNVGNIQTENSNVESMRFSFIFIIFLLPILLKRKAITTQN